MHAGKWLLNFLVQSQIIKYRMLLFVLNLIALKIVTHASLKHKNVFGPIIEEALKE